MNADNAKGFIRAYPNLIVKDHGGYQSHHAATLAVLRETFEKYATDFANLHFDFFIGSFDNPESCNDLAAVAPHVLAYATTPQCRPNIIAVPDFIYDNWPEAGIDDYTATCAAIAEASKKSPEHDKLFWIGNADMDPLRLSLLEIAAEHPEDMECISMLWQQSSTASSSRLAASRFVTLPDHARYSMPLDIRGAGYSGRLKLLMQAGRPVFLVDRRFHEFFYGHLRPYEHYMPVKEDLADLAAHIAEIKQNKNLAQKLGAGASAFAAKYLTKPHALTVWRDILLGIASKK
jgi:hypothetical protein